MSLRRFAVVLVLALLGAMVLAGSASAAKLDGAKHGGRPMATDLTGAEEVNPATGQRGAGDPDGSGTANITINPGHGEVCWEIEAENIMLPATAAHIHVGAAGTAPPNNVVVTLTAPDESGSSSGCAQVSRELAKAILKNPENYYVNVHTSDFRGGAIRGQLSK
jgi:hypothetical protein